MQGSILVRWSDPGRIHQELSTLCSEPGSPTGTWGLLCRQGWQACEPSNPPVCFPGTGIASVHHHTHFFHVDVKNEIQVLILPGQALHKQPPPQPHYHLSGCLCFSVSGLVMCDWFFKELQNFPLCGYVLGKLSQVLFTWKCLCLASFGLWRYFFLHGWPLLMIIFLVYQRNFPTVFCFHFVKNVYQSHGHFFVDKYVSVLLKCTLFWKILSTCGHWEGSTVNWVQPSPIITQAVGAFKIFYLREQSGKNRSFLFLMFCSVYTYIVCINVRFFFF